MQEFGFRCFPQTAVLIQWNHPSPYHKRGVFAMADKKKPANGKAIGKKSSRAPAKSFLLRNGAISSVWELTRPILLTIERDDDGEFVVSDTFSTVYGNGDTRKEALTDYCESLVEYNEFLSEQAKTNEPAAELSLRLSDYLRRTK
jgi:predicted RNase H-like HicB family nuclease